MTERWNGTDHVFPPTCVLNMKAGQKLASHSLAVLSSPTSSSGTITSSACKVWMSAVSIMENCGPLPPRMAVTALVSVSW